MKHKWFNRSTVTLAALVVLLGALLCTRALTKDLSPTVMLNDTLASASALDAQQVTSTGDFFKDFRAQRETARADEIALLDTIINRENAPKESITEADARKIELTYYTEQERAIEKLLVAKGFEDVAAFVQDGMVSIVVKQEKLSDADTAKILELAMRQTEQEAGNIKIIPVA